MKYDDQVVYIIEHEHGYLKIGRSNNPQKRLQTLQTACPYELSVAGVIKTDDAAALEQKLHERFEDRQKNGEWYALPGWSREHLKQLCDLDREDVHWRYHQSKEKRRKKTMLLQGLIG